MLSTLRTTPEPRALGHRPAFRPALETLEGRPLLAALHHFDVGISATAIAGVSHVVTVTARDDAGNLVDDFAGTIRFESTSAGAKLPSDHAFSAAERGTFLTTLRFAAAGRQTLTVSSGSVRGQAVVEVVPGAPSSFSLSVAPRLTLNRPGEVRVRVLDGQGNPVTAYTGTVHFTTTDPGTAPPPDHAFRAEDAGQVTVQITPPTVGDFVLNVVDPARPQLRGGAILTVRYETANQNYVNGLYRELLDRFPDGSGLAFWGGLLDGGVARATVVAAIQASGEYHTKVVTDLYAGLLDRLPDEGGLHFFTGALGRGAPVDELAATMMTSPEYFENRGAGLVEGFVTSMLVDLVNRQPDDATIQAYGDRLAHGATRHQLVREVMASREAEELLVRDAYTMFLHRNAEEGAVAHFVAARQQGLSSEGLVVGILASEEFFARSK